MTPLSERMVEAAARAIHDTRRETVNGWDVVAACPAGSYGAALAASTRDEARAALTAALAVAEEAGAGVFVVPGEASYTPLSIDAPAQPSGHLGGYIDGHNACRAATLAGRVTL